MGTVFVDCEAGNKHAPAFADVILRRPLSLLPADVGETGIIEVLSVLPTSYPGHALLTEDQGDPAGRGRLPLRPQGKILPFHQPHRTGGSPRLRRHLRPIQGDAMSVLRITPDGIEPAGESLMPLVESLRSKRAWLARVPDRPPAGAVRRLRPPAAARSAHVALGGRRCFSPPGWGAATSSNLLELNLNGNPAYLDGFVPQGRNYLAAKPHGLVAMWMPGNVATLPMFSLVPALLAKNVCLVKLRLARSRRHGPAAGRAGRIGGGRAARGRSARSGGRRLVRLSQPRR